jgi:hypothetical protein
LRRGVGRDAVEPRARVRRAVEPPEGRVRPQERLLAGVLGIVAIAQHAHEIGEDLRPPALGELVERRARPSHPHPFNTAGAGP